MQNFHPCARLQFNNLRDKPNINALNEEEAKQIWFPYFVFDNTPSKEISKVDEKAVFHVLKKGRGQLYEKFALENKVVFAGQENYIEYQRHYFRLENFAIYALFLLLYCGSYTEPFL